MTNTTPRSGLPLLAAAQAQKHVTHNEALFELDALLHARLITRTLTAPPAAAPADGDTYLIKAGATGAWAAQDGKLAYALGGAWRFYAPFAGLTVTLADEGKAIAFDGKQWADVAGAAAASAAPPPQQLPQLGINTGADATNKLAVKSAAVLFDNTGNGTQLKLNKHASGDTASLLYQTNYSARAEMGLTGDDAFRIKVSPDGNAWTAPFAIDPAGAVLVNAWSNGETGCKLYIRSTNATEWGAATVRMDDGNGNAVWRLFNGAQHGWNAAATVMQVAANAQTMRAISAAGTINASGADYAEYEHKAPACGDVAKGQIIGFDAQGELTDRWSAAVSFGVKSTAPSLVGGDGWARDDALGAPPGTPEFDRAFAVARARVDRIAYSGKVPVNVTGASAGDYIIAVRDGEGIGGIAVSRPDFAQYRLAVGRVRAVLPDGRALIAVIVH